jgi:Fur family transcriptional regulator, ferric uptake regulator
MATMTHATTSEIDSELQARGYRLTPRRLMVVEVLAAHGGHLTVDEILSEVAARHPSTNKTTVYRTLELLSSLGMVATTDLGMGRLEYELQSHPHHHLICERCHTRIEVEDSFLEPLRARLLEHYGFTPNLDHFALFGICPDCSAALKEGR